MAETLFEKTTADMVWPAIGAAAHQGAVVLLPTGVIEEQSTRVAIYPEIALRRIR